MKKRSTQGLLFKMGLRSLKSGIAQFVSVIAIGAIALTLFVGLFANSHSFSARAEEVYEKGNLGDLWVTTQSYDPEDQAAIEALVGDGCKVEGRFYCLVDYRREDAYVAISRTIPTISQPYEIHKFVKEEDGEFLYIDKDIRGNVEYLDRVQVQTTLSLPLSSYDISGTASLLDWAVYPGKKNVFAEATLDLNTRVTGTMRYPENITRSQFNPTVLLWSEASFKKAFQAVVEENYAPAVHPMIYGTMSSLLGFGSFYSDDWVRPNQYVVSLPDGVDPDKTAVALRKYFADKGEEDNNLLSVTVRTDMPFFVTISTDVTQAKQFTFVFPTFFFSVAVLVISTTLSQWILKERTQIGTLKAMGVSKGKIYMHYMSMALFLTGLGTLIGEIVGPILIPWIMGKKYALLYALGPRTYVFPWMEGILSAVMFLAVSCLVTYLVCRKEVSCQPADSMRPQPPSAKLKPIKKERQKTSTLRLSWNMALRNIRLDIKKSAMVIIGVMGCTALLGAGFGIDDTLDYGIERDLTAFANQDLMVTLSRSYSTSDIEGFFAPFQEDIKDLEPMRKTTSVFFVGNSPQLQKPIYVLDKMESHFQLEFGLNEIAISQKCAESIGAKVGDQLTFRFDGRDYEMPIGLVYEAFFYHGIIVHAKADAFSELPSPKYNSLLVDFNEGVDPDKMDKKIAALSQVTGSSTRAEWMEQVNDTIGGVRVMTGAIKGFAILLALVVLYNLALLNFRERSRDIATLKVLGFRLREIGLSFVGETMLLTGIGVAIGLCLAYPFMLLVLGTNIVELVAYLYHMTVWSFALSFILTFVTSLAVNSLLLSRVRRVQMVESLKSVE